MIGPSLLPSILERNSKLTRDTLGSPKVILVVNILLKLSPGPPLGLTLNLNKTLLRTDQIAWSDQLNNLTRFSL